MDVGRQSRCANTTTTASNAFASSERMEVSEMGDRGAIENLMVLYTEALDGGAFERLGELFEHGDVTIEGGPHSGRQARGAITVADLYRSIVALDPEFGLTGRATSSRTSSSRSAIRKPRRSAGRTSRSPNRRPNCRYRSWPAAAITIATSASAASGDSRRGASCATRWATSHSTCADARW